jgi:hypothetical protein
LFAKLFYHLPTASKIEMKQMYNIQYHLAKILPFLFWEVKGNYICKAQTSDDFMSAIKLSYKNNVPIGKFESERGCT